MMKNTFSTSITPAISRRRLLTILFLCALMPVLPTSAAHSPKIVFEGKVVRVVDGDTLVILTNDGKQITLRLAGIDAPEKNMPYGDFAKKMLIHLVDSGKIMAHTTKTDRYGRTVAKVFSQGIDVNLALIEKGLAWHYKRYAREQTADDVQIYARSENEARARAVGLWQDASPVPPWLFRQCHKTSSECRSIAED